MKLPPKDYFNIEDNKESAKKELQKGIKKVYQEIENIKRSKPLYIAGSVALQNKAAAIHLVNEIEKTPEYIAAWSPSKTYKNVWIVFFALGKEDWMQSHGYIQNSLYFSEKNRELQKRKNYEVSFNEVKKDSPKKNPSKEIKTLEKTSKPSLWQKIINFIKILFFLN